MIRKLLSRTLLGVFLAGSVFAGSFVSKVNAAPVSIESEGFYIMGESETILAATVAFWINKGIRVK